MNQLAERASNILVAKGGTVAGAMKKAGYSPKTARTPNKLRATKAYKGIVTPVVVRWERERERITTAMEAKDLTEVQYKDMARVLDTLTQNIQLLTGGATQNIAMGVKRLKDDELVHIVEGGKN